jgi:hypothetical protein
LIVSCLRARVAYRALSKKKKSAQQALKINKQRGKRREQQSAQQAQSQQN